MTTKLLRQIHEQDQEALAERYNGTDTKQPRRVWAVEAMKPDITEAEYEAAQRAVRECGGLHRGRDEGMHVGFQMYRDSETGLLTSLKEQAELRKSNAAYALTGLRQGVSKRCDFKQAANVSEWLVQLYTLQDIAAALGYFRSMGKDRPRIPDTRAARPTVRLVLLGMTSYYEACDLGRESWSGRAA